MVENNNELKLFKKFSEQLIAAKESIENNKIDNAREIYLMLLNTYNKMIDQDYREASFTNLLMLRRQLEK